MIISPRGDAATTPTPAVFLPGRGARVGAAMNTGLAVVAIIAGVAWIAVEAATGFEGSMQRGSATLPAWLVGLLMVVVGAGALLLRARKAPWYRGWSMVEMLDRPDGITLFAGRLGARHEGLVVRRGETVEIAATHQLRTSYQYVVTAPAGEMRFTADGFVHKLTMQPLEEAAARHGITVVTVGDAARITRTQTV
ncbi:hypothetical protein [Cellulomonas xiejunii]|uniref:Uncharacterized protein n=1 Tax=Cellulomonas xiejunii TaxID=2968083 RepID=A0ABY5KNN6_9CELL|nr:hypothetical protein [Cellulomonas xiejunii]MCC2315003.1 hypothetical protein [Cellulomonas xiejunii]MCC2321530.1 hypothetical protein [Cellulomonas xiejunii]MCC2323318.1 hypothetical protein [Cellulomonas xiejunii]UUI72102.1 hypothetical protein NP048_01110 [Cellulomonas xiejunii]